jgi:acetylcholinesterase
MGYPAYGVDEDCLFVNVWTPSGATPKSKLPVWVFIGGGGYISLTNANWNGAEVVEKSGHNIIMVNFNYRVGLWGFLASERVRHDGDLNVGLLDQRMLLHWVKKHIATFGGDPNHVVIHGASAGAGSVALHMVAYGGRNDHLFVGAVAESIFFPAQPTVSELEYQFDRVLGQTGCDASPSSQQMSCLRSLPAATLQSTNFAQPFPGRSRPPMPLFYWTPCIDGHFLPFLPYTLFQQSRFVPVPVLFGTDTDEGSVFAPGNADSPSSVASFLTNNYPLLTPNHTSLILSTYAQPLPPLPQHAPYYPVASRAYGEATFTCPSLNVLKHLGNSTPRYSYRYNVHDDENTAAGIGVPHLFEAAAIFGPDNIGGHARGSYYTYNKGIVPVVMKYWISFVRALDPNVYREEGSPEWRGWDEKGERMVLETRRSRMEVVDEEEKARCAFWESLGEVLEQRR